MSLPDLGRQGWRQSPASLHASLPSEPKALLQRPNILGRLHLLDDDILLRRELRALCSAEQIDLLSGIESGLCKAVAIRLWNLAKLRCCALRKAACAGGALAAQLAARDEQPNRSRRSCPSCYEIDGIRRKPK